MKLFISTRENINFNDLHSIIVGAFAYKFYTLNVTTTMRQFSILYSFTFYKFY